MNTRGSIFVQDAAPESIASTNNNNASQKLVYKHMELMTATVIQRYLTVFTCSFVMQSNHLLLQMISGQIQFVNRFK